MTENENPSQWHHDRLLVEGYPHEGNADAHHRELCPGDN